MWSCLFVHSILPNCFPNKICIYESRTGFKISKKGDFAGLTDERTTGLRELDTVYSEVTNVDGQVCTNS